MTMETKRKSEDTMTVCNKREKNPSSVRVRGLHKRTREAPYHFYHLPDRVSKTMETDSKSEDIMGDCNKRVKSPCSNGGCFTDIPDNAFPLLDGVFVVVTSFHGEPYIHIRKYHQYTQTFYPTKVGVTLTPFRFHLLFSNPMPETHDQLEMVHNFIMEDLRVTSHDLTEFVFTRNMTSKKGVMVNRSITITVFQWQEIVNRYDEMMATILDYVYRDLNFKSMFEEITDTPIYEALSLPESYDTSQGTEYVTQLLLNALYDTLKERHGLIIPKKTSVPDCFSAIDSEDLTPTSNSVKDFNTGALLLAMKDVAHLFKERLWPSQDFLMLPPVRYVTAQFLKCLKFDQIIREARAVFCPPSD